MATMRQALHPGASPTFFGLTLTSLTPTRLIQSNAARALVSVANLANWVAGTANRVTVADDGDGTITLSAPQDLHAGASPTFVGMTLSGLTATRLVATNGTSVLASVANLATWIAGTANQITVTDDLDGTITLATPQDLDTACDFQAATLALSGNMTLTGGGSIVSTAAGNIAINPDTTGVVTIDASTVTVDGAKGLTVGVGSPTWITMDGDDLYVKDDFEVGGASYYVGSAIYKNTLYTDAAVLSRLAGTTYMIINPQSNLELFALSSNAKTTLVLTTDTYYNKNHDLTDIGDPTLAIFSNDDPDISNNLYGRQYHNGTDYKIITGPTTGVGSAPVTVDNSIYLSPRGVDVMEVADEGVYVGVGSPVNMVMDGDDLYVKHDTEIGRQLFVQGSSFFNAGLQFNYSNSARSGIIQNNTEPTYFYIRSTNIRTLAIVDFDNRLKATDLAGLGDPSLAIFSSDDPDITNNKYQRWYHDGANARWLTGVNIGTGSGDLATRTVENSIIFAPRGTDKVVVTGRGGLAGIPSSDQTLVAADDIELTGIIVRVAGSAAPVTLTSTPSIEDGDYDGQILIIQGTSANTITIQDESNLAGSNFNGDADQDFTLGQGDTLMVVWDAGDDAWYEVSRSNN